MEKVESNNKEMYDYEFALHQPTIFKCVVEHLDLKDRLAFTQASRTMKDRAEEITNTLQQEAIDKRNRNIKVLKDHTLPKRMDSLEFARNGGLILTIMFGLGLGLGVAVFPLGGGVIFGSLEGACATVCIASGIAKKITTNKIATVDELYERISTEVSGRIQSPSNG